MVEVVMVDGMVTTPAVGACLLTIQTRAGGHHRSSLA